MSAHGAAVGIGLRALLAAATALLAITSAAWAAQAAAPVAGTGEAKPSCQPGQLMTAKPGEPAPSLAFCKDQARAGDVKAQLAVAEAYFSGRGAPADHAEARKWYQMAAKQNNPQAARKLGEMYANGDGGKRDTKKALKLWQAAEKAGDPLVCILVADQLFSDVTGGQKPGPGTFAFRGGIPVADLEVVESWYQEALQRDPRPDVQQRAKYAISVLDTFKQAAAKESAKSK